MTSCSGLISIKFNSKPSKNMSEKAVSENSAHLFLLFRMVESYICFLWICC
jgi:hypothetical protein